MSVRLYHPETGGEFSAPEPAVPQWRRAGWVLLADWKAEQARKQAVPATNGTTTKTAGAAAGADPKE